MGTILGKPFPNLGIVPLAKLDNLWLEKSCFEICRYKEKVFQTLKVFLLGYINQPQTTNYFDKIKDVSKQDWKVYQSNRLNNKWHVHFNSLKYVDCGAYFANSWQFDICLYTTKLTFIKFRVEKQKKVCTLIQQKNCVP